MVDLGWGEMGDWEFGVDVRECIGVWGVGGTEAPSREDMIKKIRHN